MKKLLGLIVMAMGLVLPMSVFAEEAAPVINCTDGNGTKTCVVSINFADKATKVEFTLTPIGVSKIQEESIKAVDSEWTLEKTESNGSYNITLTSPGSSGEQDLFTYTFTTSGNSNEQCGVTVGYNGRTYKGPEEPDKPTENKQTGATLPYIALGVIALGAAGAYVATRNKSKMYKI